MKDRRGLNAQFTRHIRLLRNGTSEISLSLSPLVECLGRTWDWEEETPCLQILTHKTKREVLLIPFLVPRFPLTRRRPGVVRCFQDPHASAGTRIVRFTSRSFRAWFNLESGVSYRVFVNRSKHYIRIPLKDPIPWKGMS